MDVEKMLARALKAVDDAGIPSDLREIAFEKTMDLLMAERASPLPSTTVPTEMGNSTPSNTTTHSTATDTEKSPLPGDPESDFYKPMSDATGVSIEKLEKLVHIEEGRPRVSLKSSQMPEKNAAVQKIITILITVSRHYFNDENEVPISFCIEESKALKCYDKNFMRNINSIANLTISADKKTARVRNPLINSFADILSSLGIDMA